MRLTSKPDAAKPPNAQDMLVRVIAVAQLLTRSDSKKKQQADTTPDKKKHSNEDWV